MYSEWEDLDKGLPGSREALGDGVPVGVVAQQPLLLQPRLPAVLCNPRPVPFPMYWSKVSSYGHRPGGFPPVARAAANHPPDSCQGYGVNSEKANGSLYRAQGGDLSPGSAWPWLGLPRSGESVSQMENSAMMKIPVTKRPLTMYEAGVAGGVAGRARPPRVRRLGHP